MKLLIVDDEPLARARIRALLDSHDQSDSFEVEEASNGLEALTKNESMQADVILLDIRMPGMDGLEAANHLSQLENAPVIVFTTAYDEHALEAFDLQAIGYLVKPVKKDKLFKTIETASRLTDQQRRNLGSNGRKFVSAQVGGNLQLVAVEDIYYFRADQKYVVARHTKGELLIEDTLKHLEEEFANSFIRVHRSALAALDKVIAIQKQSDGHSVVTFIDVDDSLEISRRHLPEVRKALKDLSH